MKKIKTLFNTIRFFGIAHLIQRSIIKVFGIKIKDFSQVSKLFADKTGLEVGGPSGVFRDKGFIPIYKIIKELDGCNFSGTTIWEGKLNSGETYLFHPNKKKGTQYISEASDLGSIPNEKYNFVISSNCLEHVANPMKAVKDWLRVLKLEGIILLILPNKKYCFDHKRPVTKFSHVLDDFNKNIGEDDLTHLDEILKLHDLRMDEAAGGFEQFKERSLKNFENRALHQHIFDNNLLKEIFDFFKVETILQVENREHIILGRKK